MLTTGRLLPLASADAATQMSIDQAIWEATTPASEPTLRFYEFRPPALSLGYFQAAADRSAHTHSRSLPMVRRSTGGGAIVHDRELTYSLVLPVDHPWLHDVAAATPRGAAAIGSSDPMYRLVHDAIIRVLAGRSITADRFERLGRVWPDTQPLLCFQRRTAHDVIVAGYKVVGSAQRKNKHAVLQHGSILLRASRHAPQLPGLEDLCGRPVSPGEIADALADELGCDRVAPVRWRTGRPSDAELTRAAEISTTRFADEAWTNRR